MTKLSEMSVDELRAQLYLQTRDPIWLRGNARQPVPQNQSAPMETGARYAQDPGNTATARQFPNDTRMPGEVMSPRPAQLSGGYDGNVEGGWAKANQGRTNLQDPDLVGLRAQLYLQTRDPIWLRGNARQPAPQNQSSPMETGARYAGEPGNSATARQFPTDARMPGEAMSPRPAQFSGGYDGNVEGGWAKTNQGRTNLQDPDLVGLRAQLYLQTRDPIWLRGRARQPAPQNQSPPMETGARFTQDPGNTAASQQAPDYGWTPQGIGEPMANARPVAARLPDQHSPMGSGYYNPPAGTGMQNAQIGKLAPPSPYWMQTNYHGTFGRPDDQAAQEVQKYLHDPRGTMVRTGSPVAYTPSQPSANEIDRGPGSANIAEARTLGQYAAAGMPSNRSPDSPNRRVTSDRGRAYIKDREGYRDRVYLDTAKNSTIGYGTRITDRVREEIKDFPDKIDRATADRIFGWGIEDAEKDVYRYIKNADSLSQNQLDALVSLLYNVGAKQFPTSHMRSKVNMGDFSGAATEFDDWINVTVPDPKNPGREIRKIDPGLVNRRRLDRKLFEQGIYSGK